MSKIPRDKDNDYSHESIKARQDFVQKQTGATLEHTRRFTFDPALVKGNIEHFTGIVQMPLGIAGPLLVNGEHAKGEFYVPMATTEGTLVASYNRGMRLTREAGGVKATVVDDAMQRAPVFMFASAREARDFGDWVVEHMDEIRAKAEATTSRGKLRNIEQYPVSRCRYLRFNYTTGDAGGQNMSGKATEAACNWIAETYPGIERWLLSGNMDTDKKDSHINMLGTRGKKVIAECVLPDALLRSLMHVNAKSMLQARMISSMGAHLSLATNNGSHSPNGIAATFIATGQDEANVAESCSAIVYAELTDAGDYYYSITIPSLVVATYGGGTGLATQRECLEMMGCYGEGKVRKLAEIIGATVLCGELSLGAAVVAGEWVSSHERYGRNRP